MAVTVTSLSTFKFDCQLPVTGGGRPSALPAARGRSQRGRPGAAGGTPAAAATESSVFASRLRSEGVVYKVA